MCSQHKIRILAILSYTEAITTITIGWHSVCALLWQNAMVYPVVCFLLWQLFLLTEEKKNLAILCLKCQIINITVLPVKAISHCCCCHEYLRITDTIFETMLTFRTTARFLRQYCLFVVSQYFLNLRQAAQWVTSLPHSAMFSQAVRVFYRFSTFLSPSKKIKPVDKMATLDHPKEWMRVHPGCVPTSHPVFPE